MKLYTFASLALVAAVYCLCGAVTADPVGVAFDRQSRQLYLAPPQFYNYYNPYEYFQIFIPTAQGETEPELSSDDSKSKLGVTGKQNLAISALPVATECLIADSKTNGLNGCTFGSHASSGNINLKFSAAKQGAVIALVPNSRYSKVKIICSEVTANLKAFTKTAKISATTDTPVTELKQTQILVVSAAADDVFKCSWEALH